MEARQQYAAFVESVLAGQDVPLPDNTVREQFPEGCGDTAQDVLHCYTDGSAKKASRSAGWGLVAFLSNTTEAGV